MRITRIIILTLSTLSVMLATPAFSADFSALNIGDVFYINRVGPHNDTVMAQAALPEHHASDSHNEYKLRPDAYQIGRKTEFATKMRLENGKIIHDSQITQARVTTSSYFIREVEIIKLLRDQPSVIKQSILLQSTSTSLTENDKTQDSIQYTPLHGKVMLFEFGGGHRNISFIGEAPKASNINEDFIYVNEDEFYPLGNVQVGQEWSISGKKLAIMYGITNAVAVEGDGVLRFNKITTYQGELCALIEISMSMKVDVLTDQGEELNISMEGTGVGYRSLSNYIDIGRTFQGNLKAYATKPKITIFGPYSVDYTAKIIN